MKKGTRHSEETRKKMRVPHKGSGIYQHQGIKNRTWKLSEIQKKKMSEIAKKIGTGKWLKNRIGEKSNHWKGGISKDKRYVSWQKNLWHKRKIEATGFHTWEEWEILKVQYNWTCPCCKKLEPEIKLTEDHIIPLSKGGSDNIENIQPLCKSCNCKKHNNFIKYD